MEATQIMMMPAAGAVPTANGEMGMPTAAGSQPTEQFGALLEQVLDTLQNAGTRLAAVPELQNNEAESLVPELALLLDEPVGSTDAGAGMMAQLLGGYQQMLTAQQVAAIDVVETEVSGDGGDIAAVTATGLLETKTQDQDLAVTTDVNLLSVTEKDVSKGTLVTKQPESNTPPSEDSKDTISLKNASEQSPYIPVKQATDSGTDGAVKPNGESAQQIKVSQMHSRNLQVDLPAQTQGQPPATEQQSSELKEQTRADGSNQSSSVTAGVKTEALRSAELQMASVVTEAANKNSSQSAPQFRFSQSADVATAVDAADSKKNPSSGFGAEGQTAEQQVDAKVVAPMQGEETVLELKSDVSALAKQSDPVLPGALSVKTQAVDAAVASDLPRPVQQEQVARQVSERLATYEVKPGADQISFRLSPEHLGNLQLNFKMEDQRLKLEIIAESRGVRDALLQQADDLKETLARQNIKVDSFDVTTANGNSMSQQQRDWRQMTAEQRQYQPQFMANRSMVDGSGSEASVRYFAQQYSSTIDVRF